jgi:hypothetical protein
MIIGPGITITGGIGVNGSVGGGGGSSPVDLGTTFEWTSNTYFDAWTSQTATDSDLSITGLPGLSGYNTNNLIWQPFYAHVAIQLTVAGNKWGYVPYQGGTNSVGLRGAFSSVDDTFGSFNADAVVATTLSNNYTADVLNQRAVTNLFSVPAKRYFLLGMVGGPFYRIFKSLAANRTAQVSGSSIVTGINHFYWGAWPSGPTTGIPTQLGGSATFTKVDGYVPVLSFKFTTT